MKDNELRGIALQKLYDLRGKGQVTTGYEDFSPVPRESLGRIFEQLSEHGLVKWKPMYSPLGAGQAEITAKGVDVVEGTTQSPISIRIDQSRHYTVTNSDKNIFGDGNVQVDTITIGEIARTIATSTAPKEEREKATSTIVKAFKEEAVKGVLGTLAESVTKGIMSSVTGG